MTKRDEKKARFEQRRQERRAIRPSFNPRHLKASADYMQMIMSASMLGRDEVKWPERIERYYSSGAWTKSMVQSAVGKAITEDDFKAIVKE